MEKEIILRTEERDGLQATVVTLQLSLSETKQALDEASAENTMLEQRSAQQSDDIYVLNAEVKHLNLDVKAKEATTSEKDNQISELSRKITSMFSSNEALQQLSERDQSEALRLQKELDCAQRLLQTKMAEIGELESVRSVNNELQQLLDNTNIEKFHAIKELTQARDQVAQYKAQITSSEEDKTAIKKMTAELTLKDSRLKESNRKIFSLEEAVKGINELKVAKNLLQDKYNAVLLEQDLLLGHTNKKQKIQYIQSLKNQIQDLAEENTRLRSAK
jgi:hypothetical protein